MSKDAVFTLKLDPQLRADFMSEAAGEDRPASQVVRELMRDYIMQRRQARDYESYLQRKVDAGRASMHAGRGRSNEDVEAACVIRRQQIKAPDA